MTRLSVNINKIALLRNARKGDVPNVVEAAQYCEKHGAEGITVHPRPDERHIKYQDVRDLAPLVQTEFNIEGYPSDEWKALVKEVRPTQATLVPDDPQQLTSDHGWDTIEQQSFLEETIQELQAYCGRISLFVDPDPSMVKAAQQTGADRIELYTGPYAAQYVANRQQAISPYKEAAQTALDKGLGLNAGHDLNLKNLGYLHEQIPEIDEVSIGHALTADSLYYGLAETIERYLKLL